MDGCSLGLQVVALVNVYLLCHGYVQYGVASGKGSYSATWLSRISQYFMRSTSDKVQRFPRASKTDPGPGPGRVIRGSVSLGDILRVRDPGLSRSAGCVWTLK